MVTLTKAHVLKYKSIEDSSPVEIAGDVTVLVGKNESGKTAFLDCTRRCHSETPSLILFSTTLGESMYATGPNMRQNHMRMSLC